MSRGKLDETELSERFRGQVHDGGVERSCASEHNRFTSRARSEPVAETKSRKHNYGEMHKINITGRCCVSCKPKPEDILNIGTRHDTLDLLTPTDSLLLFFHFREPNETRRLVKRILSLLVGLNCSFTGFRKGLDAMNSREISAPTSANVERSVSRARLIGLLIVCLLSI